MPRVAVAGAGIAGLTAAWTLAERGAEVVLIDAAPRVGGKIRTEHADGLLIDAGPDSFLSTKPAAIALAERLGLADHLIDTQSDGGGTFILRAGRLQPLPEGITMLVPAEFGAIVRMPLLSPLGKARMAFDYVIPRRRDDSDESVGSFVRRRLGREAFERMAEPLLSGIYAGNADQLSLLSTFPRLRQVERMHGGMIRGALAQRREAQSRQSSNARHTPFVSFQDGLEELTGTLLRALVHCDVRLDTPVTSVEPFGDGLVVRHEGGEAEVDGLVLATPAYVTAALVEPLSPALAATLREIDYVSTATVSLAFDQADVAGLQAGRGFVIPRAENRSLTAVTWTSSKFAGRVPQGTALLRGFVGRAGNEDALQLTDEELVMLIRGELHDILGISAAPRFQRVFRWLRALPQYTLGHPQRLAHIDTTLQSLPRLVLTGSAYRGVGIPDCIADAEREASALLARLSSPG